MTRIFLACIVATGLIMTARAAAAQNVWHAVHSLAPGDIVHSEDVVSQPPSGRVRHAMSSDTPIVGLEVRRRIYAGYDIPENDLGPVLAVKASTIVTVRYKADGLSLQMQGRALEAGSVGDEIRVENPASLRTIRATVVGEGAVEVKSGQ
ncbi:flagellar basal body P-ring formation chaperone FlgA [Rhodopila globiformis]|nr:flagellar basal body P-ring formation chaperone FlgA [Rhodopila globiformis]